MPALKNLRRELFAQNVVKNARNGLNLTEAYRASGYKGTGHTAEACASRLLSFDEVKMRIDELARPAVRKTRVSIESLLDELEVTIQDARADGQHSVVVGALTLSAKLVGLLRDRIEVGSPGEYRDCQTPEDAIDALIERCGDARSVLDLLRMMTSMVEAHIANQATPISGSPSGRPRTSEG
jgi:hypothetical protein